MKKGNKFFSTHIIVALICAVVGILLLWLGAYIDNSLTSNVGSVILVSGIYTIIDSMFLKQSLIDLVIEKVSLDKDIDRAGLITIDSVLTNIPYRNLIECSKLNIDIVHNYGRTWTTNNFDFIRQVLMAKECKLRVILLNPESHFVPALEKHYSYPEGHLKQLIDESCEKWKSLYCELEDRRKSEPGKTFGTVELYYFNGQPTNSLYRFDNKIVVVDAKNSSDKSVYLPYAIYQNNGVDGLYNKYLSEINSIINESTPINIGGNNVISD